MNEHPRREQRAGPSGRIRPGRRCPARWLGTAGEPQRHPGEHSFPLSTTSRIPRVARGATAREGSHGRDRQRPPGRDANHHGARLRFVASLTQHGACEDRNEPCPGSCRTAGANSADEVNTDERTAQSLRRATGIGWQITTSGPADLPPPATAEVDALLHRPAP